MVGRGLIVGSSWSGLVGSGLVGYDWLWLVVVCLSGTVVYGWSWVGRGWSWSCMVLLIPHLLPRFLSHISHPTSVVRYGWLWLVEVAVVW